MRAKVVVSSAIGKRDLPFQSHAVEKAGELRTLKVVRVQRRHRCTKAMPGWGRPDSEMSPNSGSACTDASRGHSLRPGYHQTLDPAGKKALQLLDP